MKILIALTLVAAPAFCAPKTWTGQITDSMCGTNHAAMSPGAKTVNGHDCTLACVKAGSKFAFVNDGKVVQIANQTFPDLGKAAGATVSLTGELAADGKSVIISKIAVKK